ncbi:MAG: fibronectin type III domain-containing protein [Bacteroidales bacterium]|nr:fibronectin type III domain-containing protein [Bacteroidales bacterium]
MKNTYPKLLILLLSLNTWFNIDAANGYFDNFIHANRVSNWTSKAGYGFSWNNAGQSLQLQMTSTTANRTDVQIKDESQNPYTLNLTGYPLVRFRAYANKAVSNVNFKLIDVNNKKNDHFVNANTKVNLAGNKWEEFTINYTGKLYYDGQLHTIDISQIKALHFDVTDGVSDALIYFDDFCVGVDAARNVKPRFDAIPKPNYILSNAPMQTIPLSGIDDGNPEREEQMTITAVSSNQSVVADGSIHIIYDGISGNAQLQYTITGNSGIAEISVTVKDDRGTAYTGEEDAATQKFIVEVRNPALNNSPIYGGLSSTIYAGKGSQVITVKNVTDGDDDKTQNLTLSAVSTNQALLTIESVQYNSADNCAFIFVKDQEQTGTANIQLTLTDDGGTANGGVNSYTRTESIPILKYSNTCANFVQFDIQHWQPRPLQTESPTTGSYVKICTSNTPIENLERNFFWSKMYGYIVPSVTDNYNFQGFSNEGFYFYLNKDDGISTLPANLTTMVEDSKVIWSSTTATPLVAGKPYYFEAYSRDIVNNQAFWLKWSSTSSPTVDFIANENLMPDYDVTKPSMPASLQATTIGVNDVKLTWSASTDNKSVKGYLIFVDGVCQNDNPISETEYLAVNLKPNTSYSFHVVAVDNFENYSTPSNIVNAKTYNVDAIAPPKPTNLKADFTTAFAVKLSWSPVVDNETQTRGYTIYQDGKAVKTNINATSFLVTDLSPTTNYSFTVTAVDANYNESLKSDALMVKTPAFDPTETRDDVRKGKLSINLTPLCKADGFGIGVDYEKTSILSSNKVMYGGFESPSFETFTDSQLKQATSNATLTRVTDNPYQGSYCGKVVSNAANGYFRKVVSTPVDLRYTYLVRFAMRKDPLYTGTVRVNVSGNGGFSSAVITPTNDWKMYEVDLTTTYQGVEETWWLDFITSAPGTFYIDNIEFHNKNFYKAGSPFSTKVMDLLREFKPSSVRWGGINANGESFNLSSGLQSEATLSYADWVKMNNELGARASIVTGISNATDFKSNTQTFKSLVEYLAGDASTVGGAIREKEGYDDLMTDCKGVNFELGNEVWGAAVHVAEIGADYTQYGAWCRGVANTMRNTPAYDATKMTLTYSGRAPDVNYGLHKKMLTGDTGEMDILSLSGYLGGNLNLETGVDPGASLLDYYKNGLYTMQTKFSGFQSDWTEMKSCLGGRVLPMYLYEGNMTQNSYNGRLGQAVIMADYYSSAPLYGAPLTTLFHFDSGQWRLIDNPVDFKKMPLFYIGKYVNNYCKGSILGTTFTSSYKIYTGSTTPVALTLDPVGCKAYADSTNYTVALYSRDFEHDFVVQIDLPDNILRSSKAHITTVKGESFSATDVVVDEQEITDFTDSILVKVPKYSVVFVRFKGEDKSLTAPLLYPNYQNVRTLKISSTEGKNTIESQKGSLHLRATTTPSVLFASNINWEILDNDVTKAYFTVTPTTRTISGSGLLDGNGTVRVVATATDGSGVSDVFNVAISNQGTDGIAKTEANRFLIYPNPVKDILYVNFSSQIVGSMTIYDLQGKKIDSQMIKGENEIMDVRKLRPGFYLLKASSSQGVFIRKFSKE